MYRRIIDRYLKKVLEYLPVRDRRKARRIISGMIYEMLEEHTDREKPTAKEVREVLKELGTPGELAYAYYDEFHKPLKIHLDVKKIFQGLFRFITVLASILVAAGVISLVMGVGSMIYMVFGTALGVLVVLYQMVMTVGEEKRVVHDIQSYNRM